RAAPLSPRRGGAALDAGAVPRRSLHTRSGARLDRGLRVSRGDHAGGRVRVLVVDESPERAEVLREGLRSAGYEVSASLSSPVALRKPIEERRPDVIAIETDSPSRDVLEHLMVMSQRTPRPVVMFASDGAPETIREAVKAGVSAYVVDGLSKNRIRAI